MNRTSTPSRRTRTALVVAAAAGLLSACSASAGEQADQVGDQPGVIKVEVRDEGVADHDIPLATVPRIVTVTMAEDATSDQVLAVFGAYDDQIDEGDVISVEVTLSGPRAATLASGEGVHVTEEGVADLLDAQHDPAVVTYRRDDVPTGPGVSVELTPTDFAGVVARADRYRDEAGLDAVSVTSGDLVLVRDRVNEEPRVTAAREELVRALAQRFAVRGATVTGRGPLRVVVAPQDRAAARRFVAVAAREDDEPGLGRVVVRAGA
ncbi:hypothetical protein [Pimelobacter simplex]|uniref:hypothetical protein n=1 Tax=Nocardioides simplex TaxID=2045 RepID=UPI003AAE6740